jgi:hypothetical protein
LAVQPVQSALASSLDADEADLTEHAEVLGNLGLGPAELRYELGDITLAMALR